MEVMKALIETLNNACDAYYNSGRTIMSDYKYDLLYQELLDMESESGIVMANSPTQRAGYEVKNELVKVVHEYPMLSLDKTKSTDELVKFVGNKDWFMMLKLDGLTCALYYENGKLVKAETRGDGVVGCDILHHAKAFTNIPLEITYKEKLVIFGEAIIDYCTFYKINEKLPKDERYANPRNLASGTLNNLDSKVCSERKIKFIAWRVVKGFDGVKSFHVKLSCIESLGFDVVPYISHIYINRTKDIFEIMIEDLKEEAKLKFYPIDGMVISFDDIEYMESLGSTSHHMRSQLAFKFSEDKKFTTLREIEWSPSRIGNLNPVAIFDEIELAGTNVSRASLHNLSIMEELNVKIGSQIEVCKRNEIIPNVESSDGIGKDIEIPSVCPVCGSSTEIKQENNSKVLICINPNCKAKLLGKLELACSKEGFDIDGLSTAQLQVFIDKGWLKDISDIYKLHEHKVEMTSLSGFGLKSVNKLLAAIEKSKEIELSHFIRGLGIPLVGKTQAKLIAEYCYNDINEFLDVLTYCVDLKSIDGIGDKIVDSIYDWSHDNRSNIEMLYRLIDIMYFKIVEKKESKANLEGQVYVITGSLKHFSNRNELKEVIENAGGKVSGSISSKTTALINNDVNSTSSKNKKAKELGINIITEEEIMKQIGL